MVDSIDMVDSIKKMTDAIADILDGDLRCIRLFGSVVFDDFRFGWSDIDLIALSGARITESQAQKLLTLRQTLAEREPGDPYYRLFEGVIANVDEYREKSCTRSVYWGTSGQRIVNRHMIDVFSQFELSKYSRCVYGEDDRSIFSEPCREDMVNAVREHYETIRKYAGQTDERLYSCGWLLDIARCIYTLRYNDVTAKTQAGVWALENHIFVNEAPLRRTLEIRRDPLTFKNREDVKQWLTGLGPTVQEYADVLEKELSCCTQTR